MYILYQPEKKQIEFSVGIIAINTFQNNQISEIEKKSNYLPTTLQTTPYIVKYFKYVTILAATGCQQTFLGYLGIVILELTGTIQQVLILKVSRNFLNTYFIFKLELIWGIVTFVATSLKGRCVVFSHQFVNLRLGQVIAQQGQSMARQGLEIGKKLL